MMDDNRIREIIHSLTLEEKAALCSGADNWTTKPNVGKGIPVLRMADGPHGVRREDLTHTEQNGGASVPATCFPPAVTLACTWSTVLAQQVGQALAEECLDQGVHLLLGPGTNIKRSPLGGRNFEYFSEDPLLAGELSAAWINGLQSLGVGASLKHYALNNQERKRMSISAEADERAFFDIYLKPFEIAVGKAKPATVMASYNRIAGVYACDNRRLLTEILRLRFGFDGVVVSDWGAVNDRAQGIFAGMDLEMPASGGVNDEAIVQAVQRGSLSEDALDTACWNLLRLIFKYSTPEKPATPCDYAAHHQLAATVAAKGAVLLKNEGGLLPFKKDIPLCVIGEMAEKPRFQGGGSSIVNPTRLESFLDALKTAGMEYSYHPGYQGYGTNDLLISQAATAAQKAQQVALFIGLPDLYDCEGYDRDTLALPDFHLRLLEAVAAVCPRLCVVLCGGGVVEAPWLGRVQGLLCLHLGGQAGGEGARRVLFGEENPGGKLAETWPLTLQDTPCYHHFPMGPSTVTYNESVYVGYRYYNTPPTPEAQLRPVRFPFGYGLSYTRFEYSGLSLSHNTLAEGDTLTASFTVANTGGVDGEEVSQLYLYRKGSPMFQPAQELAAFTRTALKAGATQQVSLQLPWRQFACHHPATGTSVVQAGEYTLLVGPHSRALPLCATVQLQGVSPAAAPGFERDGAYGQIADNCFPTEAFAALLPRTLYTEPPAQKGNYTMHTTLDEMQQSMLARMIHRLALIIGKHSLHFSKDPLAAQKVIREAVADFPFKNLVLFSQGIVGHQAAQQLLRACNGQGGLARALRLMLRGARQAQRRRQNK